MRDIEDEVKCSECPNARHGFDRDASHNEGRYVCQCESHKCPAESLRQQLAEANAEIERLKLAANIGKSKDVRALAEILLSDCGCSTEHRALLDKVENRLWTFFDEQLAAIQAREQQLREALNHHHEIGLGRGRDKSHSLSQLIISGYRHGPLCRITDEALALPQDTSALSALIANAGEVMREVIAADVETQRNDIPATGIEFAAAIRAIHAVTLDDLK